MPAKNTLANQELEIMKIVWDLGQATVRDVYERLLRRRRIAYTTVMTTMKTLEQKGFLKHSGAERAYVYEPARAQGQVVGGMVRDFVDRVFNGSARPLLVHLVKDRKLSEEDLAELRRLIREGK